MHRECNLESKMPLKKTSREKNGVFGERLPPDELVLADCLPLKPKAVSLEGKLIRVEPLVLSRDLTQLYCNSNGEPICLRPGLEFPAYDPELFVWRYLSYGPFTSAQELGNFLQLLIDGKNCRPLVVRDQECGEPVGIINLKSHFPEHLKIMLGDIWFSPAVQGRGFNTEACYLLLCYLFDSGYRRVEWKCDVHNFRSCKAARRLGFEFEGVQDSHFIFKNRNRDTAWFRILKKEWQSGKKTQLGERIAEAQARSSG